MLTNTNKNKLSPFLADMIFHSVRGWFRLGINNFDHKHCFSTYLFDFILCNLKVHLKRTSEVIEEKGSTHFNTLIKFLFCRCYSCGFTSHGLHANNCPVGGFFVFFKLESLEDMVSSFVKNRFGGLDERN